MADWRLAVDIGGTFTDVVLLDGETGRVVVDKTLSTPSRPLEGVKQAVSSALAKAQIKPSDIRAPIVHATTLVTNAVIEGKMARAALVTNAGFADTLLIRNEHRYDMYDLQIEFPDPPIPRALTFEIDERTTAEGVVLREPSDAQISALADTLAGTGVEAVAICLLHSYANPTNERRIAAALVGATRSAGLRVERGRAADPRVPAHGHDRVQRGDDAGRRPVSGRVPTLADRCRASAAGC